MCRLAASTFTDEHHGRAITKREYEDDKKLREAYKQELDQARKIIASDLNFQALSYQEKIVYAVELIKKLIIKNHGYKDVFVETSNEPEEKYASLDDLLDTIPQEPYHPIIKGKK